MTDHYEDVKEGRTSDSVLDDLAACRALLFQARKQLHVQADEIQRLQHARRHTGNEVMTLAVVEAIEAALDGVEPSDFMLSFPIVRKAWEMHDKLVEQRVIGHGEGQEHTIADVNAGRVDDLIQQRLATPPAPEQAQPIEALRSVVELILPQAERALRAMRGRHNGCTWRLRLTLGVARQIVQLLASPSKGSTQ